MFSRPGDKANPEAREEMSKLELSDIEQNQADDELSTLSGSDLFDDDSFFGSDDDDEDNATAKKPKKQDKAVKKNKAAPKRAAKDQNFIKRDIAEGRTFNNSFTGPYPEDTDHLHIDKGPNPQFDFLKQN